MVLRRGDTRHKDVPDPLEAGPKRVPTIHAQRKFAQGSGLISPGMSPIKEKEKSGGKLNGGGAGAGMGIEHHSQSPSTSSSISSSAIPAKRPRTEDFITFLCYRGTSVLPTELNSFNVASKPEKFDRDNSAFASVSAKQCSNPRQEENKMKRMKCTKRVVMQSKSKVLDQRQRKTRINAIVQKAGKILKNQKANSKAHGKRVAAVTVASKSKQIKARPAGPIRASHASILKRLGASRVRAGLRSSGQLPAGSDIGLKVEKKPLAQKYLKNKILSSKHKVDTPVRMKAKVDGKIPLGTPLSRRATKGRDLKNTPSKSTPPRSLNIFKRPSRKTKEAAAIYMELITKDLRSPEEEDASAPSRGDDVLEDSSTIKTRARSGTTDTIFDVSPISAGKVLKKKVQQAAHKKNLKPNSNQTTSKNSMKRTRSSLREEANYDSPLEEETKPLRKSANSDRLDRSKTKSISGGRIGKKVENPNSNVPRKNVEEVSEMSSQSEDDEGSGSQPLPKRVKKGTKNDDKQSNSALTKEVKHSSEQDLAKRSTRSSRGIEADIKVENKTVVDKKNRAARSKMSTNQIASESESSSSDEEEIKPIKKEVLSRTRQTIKKELKSESEGDEDTAGKKPSRLSKMKENDDTVDEEESNKPVSKLSVGKKSLDKEPNEEIPKKRAPGRPRKISGTKIGVVKHKEMSKKNNFDDEKGKKTDSKINKTEVKSESSSGSETETKTTRLTRNSKTVNSDNEKKSSQMKRTSKVNVKAESDNEDVSDKIRKASKCGNYAKEESAKAKRLSRQAALRSEESDDEELLEKVKKTVKSGSTGTLKLKRPSRLAAVKAESKKVDDSEESEEPDKIEAPTKSVKLSRKSSVKATKSEVLSDHSDESDKETSKSRKSARQLTSGKVESGDEVKKVKVTRQSMNLESDNESEKEAQKQTKTYKPSKETSSKPGRKKSMRNVDDNSAYESEGSSRALVIRSKPTSKLPNEADVPKKATSNEESNSNVSTTKTSSKTKPIDASKNDKSDKESSQPLRNSIKIEVDPSQSVTVTKPVPAKRGRPSKASLKNNQCDIKDQNKLLNKGSDEIASSKGDKINVKGSIKDKTAVNKPNDAKTVGKKTVITKDKPEPKKRGRKPKKLEQNLETTEEESQIRTSRRRAATKKETYSEFTEGEDEEEDEDSEEQNERSLVTLSRTRGRKSNVKYTEKDTDDEEFENEKRPLRARRSVFRATFNVELDSDDEYLDLPTARQKKSEDSEFVTKKKKEEGKLNVDSENYESDASDKSQEIDLKKTKRGKMLAGTDASSQSSQTTRRNSFGSKTDFPATDEKSDSFPKKSLDSHSRIDFGSKVVTNQNDANEQSISENLSIETKRVTRRLSKDKFEIALEDYSKPDTKMQELMTTHVSIIKSDVSFRDEMKNSFLMESLDKREPQYDDNNGLATLADVAFSELQNRKNIMGRKLSSDSATSFSSDDVLLPVRKEKVLPKAKADLPTIREKTVSDEELSDVGNEETNDDSSYDEYRKMGKPTRRKRMPKRVRKEPVRLSSQRPVRNRRAKLNNDSYVNEDSFSSDRSSTPEPTKLKPIQKRRRKSEEKLAAESKSSLAPKRIVDVVHPTLSVSTSNTSPSNISSATNLTPANDRVVKDVEPPVVKVMKETKTVTPIKGPKSVDPQWNLLLKVADSKSTIKDPMTSALKPITVQPSMKPRQPFEASSNNSVTLFSGVSGVCIMKDGKLLGGLPVSKEELGPQTNQGLVSSRVPVDSPAKPPIVHSRPVTASSSQSLSAKGNMFNSKKIQDNSIPISSTKPNIGDTWKNAFINAKFPKPGQLSPAHHSNVGTPFVRKPFSPSPKTPTKPEEAKLPAFVPTKLPGVQTFKNMTFQNFGKMGDQSPNRLSGGMSPNRTLVNNPPSEPKPHVYLSPSRVKNSPSKFDEKVETKKPDCSTTKSLTLLQYEKRSQELISSLKESHPVLVDGNQFVPAYPTKLKEYSMEKSKNLQCKPAQQPQPSPSEESSKPEGGKHLNLPFPVEQAFRKRSPITVKKPTKPVGKKSGLSVTEASTPTNVESCPPQNNNLPVRPATEIPSSSTDFAGIKASSEVLSKKKFQLTKEEINKWLIDSTNSGIEHTKGCGIFDNVQCKCTDQSRGETAEKVSVPVAEVVLKQEELSRIDHGVVEPPVQLKELDSNNKFTAETISTCKVEDYKEKMLSKNPKSQPPISEGKKDLVPPSLPKSKKPTTISVEKSKRKSSMTEEEMCEFDFRFERTSTSPRESGSEMSSPTPRDDVSSSNEEKFDIGPHSSTERKAIFLQRKHQLQQTPPPQSSGPSKRPPVPKSPCAFSAENESSVYAFEPDIPPPPALNHPFRRRGSRHKSSEDDAPPSSSIAVQVNLENVASAEVEQVLECSTQTEQVDNDGQLFYFPIESDNNPQEVIQGVQVKLQSTEGPEQKVIMKAKLVTKPSVNTPIPPNTRPLGDGGRPSQRPEQKVRPLSSTSTSTQIKPLVGAVQPTVRELQPSSSTSFTSQGTATTSDRPELTNQSTQAAAVPQLVTPSATPALPIPSPSLPDQSQPEAKVELAKQEVSPVPDSVSPAKSVPAAPAPRRSSPNEFPMPGTTPRMVDAPTFYPTEKEFQDPLEYIEQITNQAQSFGICRIVPPASFKPECKVSDDMRFTAYNQYVHKMLYRWGPNVREMTAIKKYLATQSIALKQPPWIGGMEIDLPRLYQTVQTCGGLKEVIEKKRWAKVADIMKIPKAAHDRVTKLDDIYCKFLLPYDTLSHAERSKLLEEVDAEWTERERRIALEAERESKGEKEERDENSESDEESDDGRDECITKGRTMPLSGFYRIARNTMAMWFKEPTRSAKEVENEYWRQVTSRKQHVCVNSGSIDSGTLGYGFPTAKSSSTSRHPWNLKVLTNNNGSILRSMGPLMGVTVPTLHVGMLFSACCWYRDPHGLPWIEYLHTGANKIWYGVPDLWNEELHGAMRTILPRYCQNKPIWLASDTAMVPPDLLVQQGVSLCRSVQEPGQFILVFPKAFTSTICTGYCVSESVYFAQPSWLMTAVQIFKDIKESCEPPAFALERLLFNIASDIRSSAEVLTETLPMITEVRDTELRHRKELEELGVTETERLAVSKGRKKSQEEPQEYECEICRGNLYLSLVTNVVEEANFCLQHAVETLTKDRSHVKNCKLMYSYDEEEMDEVLEKIKQRIETKSTKKQNVKTTGGSSKV